MQYVLSIQCAYKLKHIRLFGKLTVIYSQLNIIVAFVKP